MTAHDTDTHGPQLEDCTERILSELAYAYRPEHLRKVKAVEKLTPARRELLTLMHGQRLPYISNAMIYGGVVRSLKMTQQKIFLGLVLGGHFRIYRAPGPLPGNHAKSVIGAHERHHYVVRATCIVEAEG